MIINTFSLSFINSDLKTKLLIRKNVVVCSEKKFGINILEIKRVIGYLFNIAQVCFQSSVYLMKCFCSKNMEEITKALERKSFDLRFSNRICER